MLPPGLGQPDEPPQPPAAHCSLGETEPPDQTYSALGEQGGRTGTIQSHLPSLPTARGAAAPSASHPDATRAVQGQSISPFHGFSLEPLDILG